MLTINRIPKRQIVLAAGALSALAITAASCQPAPQQDNATPTLYMLHFERAADGSQAGQVQTPPGGSIRVNPTFFGPNKADIRIYGAEKPGITTLTITGNVHGACSTEPDNHGTLYNSPVGGISFAFPVQVEKSPAGQVQEFLAADLDGVLAKLSCGVHQYNGMPSAREFLFDRGTVQLHAKADNCCGRSGEANFTVEVG
jgi:hypothetical protein